MPLLAVESAAQPPSTRNTALSTRALDRTHEEPPPLTTTTRIGHPPRHNYIGAKNAPFCKGASDGMLVLRKKVAEWVANFSPWGESGVTFRGVLVLGLGRRPASGHRARNHAKTPAVGLFDYRPYWAARFGVAEFLPRTRAEMDALGWDSCDVILVTGDAYIDHPAFGMALIGRLLEAQGFRVGILAQPDWRAPSALQRARPAERCSSASPPATWTRWSIATPATRSRAATTRTRPAACAGKRPDRACIVYAQRCREAFRDVPIVIGGIEASLRRIAHYDYWSDKVRALDPARLAAPTCSCTATASAQIVEIAHRLARGASRSTRITDVRGTAFRSRAAAGRLRRDRLDAGRRARAGRSRRQPVRDGSGAATGARRARPAASAAGARAAHARGAASRSARQDRDPHAVVRGRAQRHGAVRARLAHPAPREQPGQRARARAAPRQRSTCGSTRRRCRSRPRRWIAVYELPYRARAASDATAAREDPRVRDDPLLGHDPARLLRRLHVLLDHRARGPHHPEPLARTRSSARSSACATPCPASPA